MHARQPIPGVKAAFLDLFSATLLRSMDPLIIVFGLGVGILVGLTGIGGGSLMTPLLLIVVGTQPVVAVGTDIAYGALTKTVGGWQHLRNGTVDLGVSLWLAIGSVPGSIGGVILVEALPSPPDEALLWGVAGALSLTAIVTLWRALFVRRVAEQERESVPLTARAKAMAVALGVLLGERLARRVPAAGLRPALGCAMLASALGVASKAGLDLPAVAILGPPF